MRPRDKIEREGDQIPVGTARTIKCPYCVEDWEKQGKPLRWQPSKSMTVSRDSDVILHHCFRASCKRGSGAIHLLDFTKKPLLKESTFMPSLYRYKTVPAQLWHLPDSITLHSEELAKQHVRYAPDRRTVVYPIFDVYGHEVGVVDRSYKDRKPKALTYWFNDVPKCHFPLHTFTTDAVVLVEDIPSAIRISSYMPSVALLGTSVTQEVLAHLVNTYKDVYVALDEDATDTAIQICKKYTLFFRNLQPIVLSKDVKNMTDAQIQRLLYENVR